METRRTSGSGKGLAVGLTLLVSFGLPARALAQTTDGADPSGWGLPLESPPADDPAESPPPVEEPAEPPPVEQTAPLPKKPPPAGPRFPITFSSGQARVEISGPGLETPLSCSGACSYSLGKGTYWLNIKASGQVWNRTVTVNEPGRVVIDPPNTTARGTGIALIIVGALTLGVTWVVGTALDENCRTGGSVECSSEEEAAPYLLAGFGAGLGLGAVGVVLVAGNGKPSVEVLPATEMRARRKPETVVGLGPVDGSTLPGLSLRTSF